MAALLPHLGASSPVRLHLASDALVAGGWVRGMLVVPQHARASTPDPAAATGSASDDDAGDSTHDALAPPATGTGTADETAADQTAEIGALAPRPGATTPVPASASKAAVHFVGVEDLPNDEHVCVAHVQQTLHLPSGAGHDSSDIRLPFELHLPPSLSGSYQGINGSVRYVILAQVHSPAGQVDWSAHDVQAVPRLDDLVTQAASAPQPVQTWECEHGIKLDVQLPSPIILAGDTATIPIAVSNHSPEPVHNLRLDLVRTESILPAPPVDMSSSDVQDCAPVVTAETQVASATFASTQNQWPGAAPNESIEWTLPLALPHDTATVSSYAPTRVRVSYRLLAHALSASQETTVRVAVPLVIVSLRTTSAALCQPGKRASGSVPAPAFILSATKDSYAQAADSSASLSAGRLVPPAPFRARTSNIPSVSVGDAFPRSSSPPVTPRGSRRSQIPAPRPSPTYTFPGNDSADSTTVDLGDGSGGHLGGDLSGISEHTEHTDTDTSTRSHPSEVEDEGSLEDHAKAWSSAWPGSVGTLDLGAPPTASVGTRSAAVSEGHGTRGPATAGRPPRASPNSTRIPTAGRKSNDNGAGGTPSGLAARRKLANGAVSSPATRNVGTPSPSGAATTGRRPPTTPSGIRRSASNQSLSALSSAHTGDAARSPVGLQRLPAGQAGRPAGRVVSGTPSAGLKRSTSHSVFPTPTTPTPGMRHSSSRGDLAGSRKGSATPGDQSLGSVPVRRGAAVARTRPQSLYVGSKEQLPPPPPVPPLPRTRVDSARSSTDSTAAARARHLTSGSVSGPGRASAAHKVPTGTRMAPRAGMRQASAGSLASGGAVKAKVSLDQIIAPPPPPMGGGRKAMTELGFGPPAAKAGRATSGLGLGGTGLGAHAGLGEHHGYSFKNYAAGGAEVRMGADGAAGTSAIGHTPAPPGLKRSQSNAHISTGGAASSSRPPRARAPASEIGFSAPIRAKVSSSAVVSTPSPGNATRARTRTGSSSSHMAAAQALAIHHGSPSRGSHLLAAPTSPIRVRTKSVEL